MEIKDQKQPQSGCVLEQTRLSLSELCAVCTVNSALVLEMVQEGILEPVGGTAADWSFSGTSVRRVRVVRDLQHDLDVNLPGAALALDLLEELERLNALLGRPRG